MENLQKDLSELTEGQENNIWIGIRTVYLAKLSNVEKEIYAFAYIIEIKNLNPSPVQLLSREWTIEDITKFKKKVVGDGVIGKQPIIETQTSFTYNSWAQITAPIGSMKGSYTMQFTEQPQQFSVTIPQFSLIKPNSLN